MNSKHAELCSSRRWATFIQDEVIPAALGTRSVTAPTLEIGPGYGAATDLLVTWTDDLTAVEVDPDLAAALSRRYPTVVVEQRGAESMPFTAGTFGSAFCFTMLHHVHTPQAQDEIFRETLRVLQPGAVFAGSDSIASPGLRRFHHDDVYVPVDPDALPERLCAAGFTDVTVERYDDWFTFQARVAG
jgi:SAM-dependent methyltransferase